MSDDVKKFVENATEFALEEDEVGAESTTVYDSIFSTFGFDHHPNSDKAIELKVLRLILLRENLLMTFGHACDVSINGEKSGKSKKNNRKH